MFEHTCTLLMISRLRSNNGINDPAKGKDLLSIFNDPTILEAYESKKISEIKCGGLK